VTDFAKELKEGTKKSHSAAENTKFVASFLRGVLDPEEYRKLLANFYFVYSAMEEEIKVFAGLYHKAINQISFPKELNRTPALEQDLRYYYGPMWRSLIEQSEACKTYVDRIKSLGTEEPTLLLAHHYTRYIGDLSGGQILKGIAKSSLNPKEGEGLHFYDFPDIKDAKEFKNLYRSRINSINFKESQKTALIAEANYAFKLNMDLFNELQGSASKGLFKVIVGAVKSKLFGK
tara:strand:- start:521 stop:1219 length:699 start_codon:yes stop_codon:yes gene_type:complete